jgi:hypothetical protein
MTIYIAVEATKARAAQTFAFSFLNIPGGIPSSLMSLSNSQQKCRPHDEKQRKPFGLCPLAFAPS